MRILHIVAEVLPFSHVGGLGRGIFGLSKSLASQGNDVRISTPAYGNTLKVIANIGLPIDTLMDLDAYSELQKSGFSDTSILHLPASDENIETILIDNREFFSSRTSVYGYSDDAERFFLLSFATLAWLKSQKKHGWIPDVIHCHDWHTGYAIDLLKRNKIFDDIKNIPTVFTVHNFKYQGPEKFQYIDYKKSDNAKSALLFPGDVDFRKQNPLLRGLFYADLVNTVSPTHSREVLTEEYGYNLVNYSSSIKHKISGILNGVDTSRFDPSKDTHLHAQYDVNNYIYKKTENKEKLGANVGIKLREKDFVCAYVGRLSAQKGLEILFSGMDIIFSEIPNIKLIILGDGEDAYCELAYRFCKKYPNNVGLDMTFGSEKPTRVYAGADCLLVPSRYEPGGNVVLEALRYGCVPVVRWTGGLKDTVKEYTRECIDGNGFGFYNLSGQALAIAITRAHTYFNNPNLWKQIVSNCMASERTWDIAAKEYMLWYIKVCQKKAP